MAINNFNVGVGTTSQLTRYRYVATGGETSVSGSDADGKTLSYTVGLEQVFLNGVNLVRGQDYTATNGTSVGALTALVASDVVEVFAYVPFNIANALTVSTVDAKGDLLVGTGADAVGRLAVGTDGQLLSAASGETTGLKWTNIGLGTWTSYTPALTASGTNPTLGSGSTATGKYNQIGKTVFGWAKIQFGTSGVAAGSGILRISLPIAAASAEDQACGAGILTDSSANTAYTIVPHIPNTGYVQLYQHQTSGATQVVFQDNPITVAASDRFLIHFTYEVA